MKSISGKYYGARGKSIEDLIKKIKANKIKTKVTLGGCFFTKVSETILISSENSSKS